MSSLAGMNLIIEKGNSSTKVAIYNKGVIEASAAYEKFDSKSAKSLLEQYRPTKGIMSSVADTDYELHGYLQQELHKFIHLDEHVPVPIKIGYRTPETLGKDRLAAAVGANSLRPKRDLLIIDAGTAITYDLVEASGIYIGGNISPGLTTRFRALNHFTRKLPLTKETETIPQIGNDTESAIQAGVIRGIIYEMDGTINDLRTKYPHLFVFLTGGNSNYFERRLKNIIFADINLVLTGLNRILEYNVEKE
jgi:type III pantothenate kinase